MIGRELGLRGPIVALVAFLCLCLVFYHRIDAALPRGRTIALSVVDTPLKNAYSYVYAFGDSYTDTGNFGLDPPWWQRRASNGPLTIEYLVKYLNAQLKDYAWAGAVIDNELTGDAENRVPDTKLQVERFIADPLPGPSTKTSGSRGLVFFWVGTNTLLQLLSGFAEAGDGYKAKARALEKINPNVNALKDHIAWATRRVAEGGQADVVVLSVPPVDVTPRAYQFAQGRQAGIGLMQRMCQELTEGLFSQLEDHLELRGLKARLALIDVRPLWTDMMRSPLKYGFKDTVPCYDTHANRVCNDSDNHVLFDGLHPTTRVHEMTAQYVLNGMESHFEE